jgi:hypothetical protein
MSSPRDAVAFAGDWSWGFAFGAGAEAPDVPGENMPVSLLLSAFSFPSFGIPLLWNVVY